MIRTIVRGTAALLVCATVAVAASGTATAAPAAPAESCRQSSYIPGLSPITLTAENGTQLSFQRDTDDNFPSVKVWANGVYEDEYRLPATFAAGEIEARLDHRYTLETWMGEVRQALDQVPVLRVCGPWSGQLP